ncbi:MAG TPA: autotransporter-associated beta strand repeat-containing protein [Kiritimatiellia bacterium]|nr:autotransporter-associated beta strand repeat-containing protein [Kiritimatiellia bacterium]
MKPARLIALVAVACVVQSAYGISVTMTNTDPFLLSSFNTAQNWSSGTAPVGGNDYSTAGFLLRTPRAGGNFTFAGDSLTIDSLPGEMMFAGTASVNTITIDDLRLDGGSIKNGSTVSLWTLEGGITINADSFFTFSTSGANTTLIASTISGVGALVTRQVGGAPANEVLRISGDNTYSGGTILNTGRIHYAHDNALGSGPITIASNGVTLLSYGAARTLTNALNIFGNFIHGLAGVGSVSAFNGPVSLGADVRTIQLNNSFSVGGAISGAGGIHMSSGGGGTLTLTGTNTFTGPIKIDGGFLWLSGAASLGGGTYAAAITNNTLLRYQSSVNQTLSGVLSGSGNLWALGSGTLTLSGANTYSGSNTLAGGKLSIAADSALGATPGSPTTGRITFNGGTLLSTAGLTLHANRGIALVGNGTVEVASGTALSYGGIIAGSGAFNKTGAGTLVLGGANTFSGAFSILSGGVEAAAVNNASANGALGNSAAAVTLGSSGTTGTVHYSGGTASSSKPFALATGGSGGFDIQSGAATLSLSGLISGGGGLAKSGAGTLTLSGANTYTGPTIVNAGVLKAGVASVSGVSGAFGVNSAVTLANTAGAGLDITGFNTIIGSITGGGSSGGDVTLGSATLTIGGNNTSPAAYAGTISGAGSIVKVGSGALTFSGSSTYSGGTVVSNGSLAVNGSIADSAITVAGGTLAGTGTVNQVTLDSGTLSPAGGSVGRLLLTNSLVLNGGRYEWNITNGTGTAGVNWDLIRVNGGAGVITIGSGIITINVSCALATLPNFTGTAPMSWMIAEGGSVSGYASNKFAFTTTNFAPAFYEGTFNVSESGGDLYLNFSTSAPIDMAVASVTSTPFTVDVGTAYAYTIVISNAGPETAGAYHVTNHLPANVVYSSSSDGGTHNAGVVRWTLNNLAAGATKTLTLNVIAPGQHGIITNRVTVLPRRVESAPSDNEKTASTTVICPGAPAPYLEVIADRVGTNGSAISFSLISTNVDCSRPFIAAVIPGGLFSTADGPGDHGTTGTFNWTPGATGVYPMRIYAWNIGSATSSYSMRIYVGAIGEPKDGAGIPVSLTNWAIAITNISPVSSGNATLVWQAVENITYDIFTTVGNFGDGAVSWSKTASGAEAVAALATQQVAASGSQRYFEVVLEGQSPKSNGVWAIIKPTIPQGYSTLAAPVDYGTNLSFAGAFGDRLAGALDGNATEGDSDEVFILNANGSYSNIWLNASKVWVTKLPGNPPATHALQPGQGFVVKRLGAATSAEFIGPVGNQAIHTNAIPAGDGSNTPGFAILSLSQGKYLPISTAFAAGNVVSSGGGPAGSIEFNKADVIYIPQTDGSYKPLQRHPNGTWFDLTTFTTSSERFTPGKAYWYHRTPTGQLMRVRF